MTNFLKKPVVIISLIILIGGIIGGYAYLGRDNAPTYDFVVAEKRALVQEVSVTGRVKPAESVQLAFEKSGKVSRVYADVGDKVGPGQMLVFLENGEISAQLLQAEANVESEQAKLAELEQGTRQEELHTYETKVGNTERSLDDAEKNLEVVTQKAEADLEDAHTDALAAAQDAVSGGKIALLTLTGIQYAHFASYDQYGASIADAKAAAVQELLGTENAGRFTAYFISTLDGGAFGMAKDAAGNPTHENISAALAEAISALQKVKQALDAVPSDSEITATETTNLNAEKSSVNSKITSASGAQAALAVQKAANADAIALAAAGITTARNTLSSAESDLALKKAGTAPEQISSQRAKVKSAQANAQTYRAQLAKTIIRSPLGGVITAQDAKVGEIVAANAALVSLISEAKFEIEANVPEADIAKVSIGNTSLVTLDAYGRNVVFEAKVVAVDPAETIVDGVATYKVTFQFVKNDERVKSGMTANIDIASASRENVIAIPQRAIIRKNGDQFVRIADGERFREVKVETGLRGSDGNIEIISGISEGDKVITFSEE